MSRSTVFTLARQIALTVAVAGGVTVASIATGALLVAPVVSKVEASDRSVFRVPDFSNVAMPTLSMPTLSMPAWSMPNASTITNSMSSSRSIARAMGPYAIPLLVSILVAGLLVRTLRNRRPRPGAYTARSRMMTPARSRTPRAVEALAARGSAHNEIAWRTGLSVDAVAMLLALSSTRRQLQPPSA